jgi:hypothetical protein
MAHTDTIHQPHFHIGFVVADLEATMREFSTVLGLSWRPVIESTVPLLGPDGVEDLGIRAVYSAGGAPAIELVESVPGTPLEGNGGSVDFHHLGLWTPELRTASEELDAHGWPCVGTVPDAAMDPSRFTLQRSPHGFYVELFDMASAPYPDLLPASVRSTAGSGS